MSSRRDRCQMLKGVMHFKTLLQMEPCTLQNCPVDQQGWIDKNCWCCRILPDNNKNNNNNRGKEVGNSSTEWIVIIVVLVALLAVFVINVYRLKRKSRKEAHRLVAADEGRMDGESVIINIPEPECPANQQIVQGQGGADVIVNIDSIAVANADVVGGNTGNGADGGEGDAGVCFGTNTCPEDEPLFVVRLQKS